LSKRRKTIYTSWSMPDPATNYVPLPKGIYRIGLSGEEISIYGYLFSLENENYQCWPSYKMSECEDGKLSLEEFSNWLKRS
jgi:hypothetical protein